MAQAGGGRAAHGVERDHHRDLLDAVAPGPLAGEAVGQEAAGPHRRQFLANLGQHVGQLDPQGGAYRGQYLRGGFLAAAFQFGEVRHRDPGRSGHIGQRAPLPVPGPAQHVAEQRAQQRLRALRPPAARADHGYIRHAVASQLGRHGATTLVRSR